MIDLLVDIASLIIGAAVAVWAVRTTLSQIRPLIVPGLRFLRDKVLLADLIRANNEEHTAIKNSLLAHESNPSVHPKIAD